MAGAAKLVRSPKNRSSPASNAAWTIIPCSLARGICDYALELLQVIRQSDELVSRLAYFTPT
jgi:hypothetical protein